MGHFCDLEPSVTKLVTEQVLVIVEKRMQDIVLEAV